MTLRYNRQQQMEYLHYTDRIGARWVDVFQGNTEFYSTAYWDLFTRMWRNGDPVRKTDALGFMKGIKSAHTAGKYLDTALAHGLLIETVNPQDARSKLLSLSPAMERRLDTFFDAAVGEMSRTCRVIDEKGPSPAGP
tara:strand:- start:1356 stop:1766 length:411 start_codon:yes stop_codon:yes gene_type:complete